MRLTTVVIPVILLGAACGAVDSPQPAGRTGTRVADASLVADGNTRFALDLYRQLSEREGNLFLAPQTISTALAMTYAGAEGETAAQMADVLHFTAEGESLHRALAKMLAEQRLEGAACELHQANALWGQEGYRFLDDFTDLMEQHYDAGLKRVDFAGETEQARTQINDWVAEQTRQRIEELLQEGDIDPATALVLASAVYFKGQWATQFDPEKTHEAPFYTGGETSVPARMMAETSEFRFADVDGVQVLELPYACEEFSMYVLLPRERDGLATLEQSLTLTTLQDYLDRPRAESLRVELPRFSLSTRFDLAQTLSAMGMTDAFRGGVADFSGMTGDKDLFISAVISEANIDVTEEGTEAAGATAVTMKRTAMPPSFRADHPFLFVIRHGETGAILFLGRVADPTVE